jgi:histidyl-tRNA synthetase
MKISVHRAPGTRDFLPEEMALRRYVLRIIVATFELYGFQPMETPATERLDILTGKYGEEADRLIFKILKRGEELEAAKPTGDLADLGLRYDLTVPVARVVAMHRGELTFPFKRYQIQPVWRAERQQKGRYREFVQCDVDIIGMTSLSADAEIIAVTDDVLQKLGIPGYRIHVNHRIMLHAIAEVAGVPSERFLEMCVIIDKMDKMGAEGVRAELLEKGFDAPSVDRIMSIIMVSGPPQEVMNADVIVQIRETADGRKALEELNRLFGDLKSLGVREDHLSLTLHLARGLDYYTGPIFEALIETPRIGSIAAGGRYDNLIGMFSSEAVPAVGVALGFERIFDVMRELKLFGEIPSGSARVLVAVFSPETEGESLKIAAELRCAGIPTEVFLEPGKKLGKQFAYADKKRIPYVVVAGPDEISRGEVTLKNLGSGEQKLVSREQLIKQLIL